MLPEEATKNDKEGLASLGKAPEDDRPQEEVPEIPKVPKRVRRKLSVTERIQALTLDQNDKDDK